MPTIASSSTARLRAAPRPIPLCVSSASVIWRPIVSTGLRLASGSWKIIAIRAPRILRISSSLRPIRLRPSNTALLSGETLLTFLGSRPSSDSALTLLPEPDSPTSPSDSPGLM